LWGVKPTDGQAPTPATATTQPVAKPVVVQQQPVQRTQPAATTAAQAKPTTQSSPARSPQTNQRAVPNNKSSSNLTKSTSTAKKEKTSFLGNLGLGKKKGKKGKDDDFAVSSPFNLQQKVHVDFNSSSGFTGLPPEWESSLITSGIDKKEIIENSQAVLDVLGFMDNQNKPGTKNVAKPTNQNPELAKLLQQAGQQQTGNGIAMPQEKIKETLLKDLVNHVDNPLLIYEDQVKVGEGATGEVFLARDKRNKSKCAIKKMQLNKENIKMVITEIEIMQNKQKKK